MSIRFLISAFIVILPALGFGASLPDNPASLIEKSQRIRQLQNRVWDLDTGKLGNLKGVRIVAPECAVRIVSGGENKIVGLCGKRKAKRAGRNYRRTGDGEDRWGGKSDRGDAGR